MLTYVFGFSGEIPVALLRWKFVENRTVELKGNAGLMLPSNIGELGDSVTKIAFATTICEVIAASGLSASSFFFALTYIIGCTGEIPVVLLRWKFVDGKTVEFNDNAGLQLPANIGELGDSVTKIDLSYHKLRGGLSTRTERLGALLTLSTLRQENYPRSLAI